LKSWFSREELERINSGRTLESRVLAPKLTLHDHLVLNLEFFEFLSSGWRQCGGCRLGIEVKVGGDDELEMGLDFPLISLLKPLLLLGSWVEAWRMRRGCSRARVRGGGRRSRVKGVKVKG
jgi:hypothetical protein